MATQLLRADLVLAPGRELADGWVVVEGDARGRDLLRVHDDRHPLLAGLVERVAVDPHVDARDRVDDRTIGVVDELAPRVAELVLTRVAATLVEQVSGSVTAHVQDGLAERVRAETADSERRISAHVDEAVLALLYLGLHDRWRAWKGFDWDAMDRLHEKGMISNPASKAKSVVFTEEGLREAERLFRELFAARR